MVFFVLYQISGPGERHKRLIRLSHIREHDAVPAETFPRAFLNVKDQVGQIFIEDARLDLERHLLGGNPVTQFSQL